MKECRNLLATVLSCLLCLASAAAAESDVQSLPSPAGVGSAQPNLAVAADGKVYLSWQEPSGDGGTALRYSTWQGSSWSDAQTATQGQRWFVNWADFPSMVVLSDGSLAAHWLVKSASSPYAYDVQLARSADGRNWSEPVTPHRDATPTEHGFVSLIAEDDGLLGAVWLDGRLMTGEEGHGHPSGGSMTLRYAALTPSGEIRNEALLDPRVCDCCQTSAARTSKGVVAVYRNRSEEEIRDIYAVTRIGGRWSDPFPVAEDKWVIPGCPVNGPSVAAEGDLAAVAWFSMAGGEPKVQAAFSQDAGRSFGPPIRIDSGRPVGRVAIVLLDDGSALVSRLEWSEDEEEPLIRARRVFADGRLGEDLRVAASGAARSTGFPRMVRSGRQIFFAWTDTSNPTRVRTARHQLN